MEKVRTLEKQKGTSGKKVTEDAPQSAQYYQDQLEFKMAVINQCQEEVEAKDLSIQKLLGEKSEYSKQI